MKELLVIIAILIGAGRVNAFDRSEFHDNRLGDIPEHGVDNTSAIQTNSINRVALSTDFLISESTSPARFDQQRPFIMPAPNKGWLAVWVDARLGVSSLFMRTLDSAGLPVGTDKVLATNEFNNLVDPLLAADSIGNQFLFYRDRTRGMIFGRKSTDITGDDYVEFLINDTSFDAFAGLYDAAVYPDGRVVVVWENYSFGNSDIAIRIYDTDGSLLLPQGIVNSDTTSVNRWAPTVAINPAAGLIVAWEDYRNLRADLYARQFNGAGVSIGPEFGLVPFPDNGSDQFAPVAAYSSVDQFVIAWVDQRLGQEIYYQRFDGVTGLVGSNIILSEVDPQRYNWQLDLCVYDDGKLSAGWASIGSTSEILLRNFQGAVPEVFTAVNVTSTGSRWESSLATRSDQVAIAWTEVATDDGDIHFTTFDNSLSTRIVTELRLNDDSVGAHSVNPSIVSSSNWFNLIAFVDQRDDAGDVYLQTIVNDGSLTDGNQRVNQDVGNNLQSDPMVASLPDKALAVWVDSRDVASVPGLRIFGRYVANNGMFIGNEFIVSDSSEVAAKASPAAAANSSGRTLIVWLDNRFGSSQVLGRWFDADGLPDGNEIIISNVNIDSTATDLTVGVDNLGRFTVLWLDNGLAVPKVKGAWYESSGSPGGSFAWEPEPGVIIDNLSAVVNPIGDYSLLWIGINGATSLNLNVIDNSGTNVSSNIVVTDYPQAFPSQPALAVAGNGYLGAVWKDENGGGYYQIFDDNLEPVGNNTLLTSGSAVIHSPAISLRGGRAWLTWSDARDDGLNIYANQTVFLPTNVGSHEADLPISFALEQNFPNPFNPSTEISFSLAVRSDLKLVVFNLAGQQVKVIAVGDFSAGQHTVSWNGEDESGKEVASGVYFYRLEAETFSQSRKMMLLK